MQDFLLVAAILCACTVVGYPACLLLPAATFKARFVVAPTIGFAVLSAGIISLYKLGVSPRLSLYAMCATGLLMSGVHLIRRPPQRTPDLAPTAIELGCATTAIVLLCLLPAWIGGPTFTVFQGNVYDQFNVYLPGSVVFHQYDYATVMAVDRGVPGNPVVASAKFALNRPISVVHAAFAGMTHATAVASGYAFTLALQVNMFFSALFLALHVFEPRKRIAILAASALTVGFFQQYVLDINAWGQLATQPIYFVVVAIVVIAFDPFRFGARPVEAFLRLTVFFGLLMTGAMIVYPDSCGVYGIAAVSAGIAGLVAKNSWDTKAIAFSGLGLATTAALSLSYWFGSLPFFIATSMLGQALKHLDWWKYFQAYLFGRMANHVVVLSSTSSWTRILISLLMLPAEFLTAGIGLYWFLPGGSLPRVLAAIWLLILCGFVFLVFATAISAAIATWREKLASNMSRLLAACVAACVVPIAFVAQGLYWTAGKSLSIAAPLLFFFIVAPLLSGFGLRPLGRMALTLFLAGHLTTGVLRSGLAAYPSGKFVAGLPGSSSTIEIQKAGMDWRMDRFAEQLRGCRGVILNIKHPFMNLAAQMVATDLGLPWASLNPIDLSYAVKPPYQPAGWERADCIASDDRSELDAGRRVIWLITDKRTFEFLDAASGGLEIGVSGHPGIAVDGAYAIENLPNGRLRWTSGVSRFGVSNSPGTPAKQLVLTLWPIAISPGAQLWLTINGWIAFEGSVPSETLRIPLDRFATDKWLTIELKTMPTTRFPRDPRDLGVALREMRLEKSP